MNKHLKLVSCLFLVFFGMQSLQASPFLNSFPADTSEKNVKKMANQQAHRAAIMSAILPGLGQAYNKKYWKIPIVYAAFAGMGYLLFTENMNYQKYHKELVIRFQHGDSLGTGGYVKYGGNQDFVNYSTNDVNTEKLYYKKYRDLSIVGLGIVYVLNIIDASIDGHFKTFDVSDNLSLQVAPKSFFCGTGPFSVGAGICLSLHFK